jgi:hypothetical protein
LCAAFGAGQEEIAIAWWRFAYYDHKDEFDAQVGRSLREADRLAAQAGESPRGPATASALVRDLGYSQRRVREALKKMQLADQFETRLDGNRKEYSIEPNRGWGLLFQATPERAAWFNWRAYGRAISTVWRVAFTLKEEGLSEARFSRNWAKRGKGGCTARGHPLGWWQSGTGDHDYADTE